MQRSFFLTWTIVPLFLALASRADAQPAKLPADLDLIPRDGYGFISVRVADLWQSEATAVLRDNDSELAPMIQGLPALEKTAGIKLAEVERAILFFPGDSDPVVVVHCTRPIDRDRLLKSKMLNYDVPQKWLNGRPYYVRDSDGSALLFPDDQTVVLATVKTLEAFVKARQKGEAGFLAPALEAAASSQATVAFRLPEKLPAMFQEALDTIRGARSWKIEPLLSVRSVLLTMDLQANARVRLILTFAGPREAVAAETVLRQLHQRAVDNLPDFREGLADSLPGFTPAAGGWPYTKMTFRAVAYLKTVEDGLKKAEIRREETKLELSLRLAKSRGLLETVFVAWTVGPMFLPVEAPEKR
jgi:hypothetical protein